MNTISITETIELPPQHLHSGYREIIKQQIMDRFTDTCTKSNGYVFNVSDDFKIESNKLSNSTSNILFRVTFDAMVLKPEIDCIIECDINMIWIHGLFASLNKLKILIPKTALTDYTFDQSLQTFVHKKTNKIFEIEQKITVKLTSVRYVKNKYDCIAKLEKI
mgnify:CR=1 FL=1|tara:strand:- start:180 stop:668 length:489 start_codon:yes stop_codon:yes gene_type:complete